MIAVADAPAAPAPAVQPDGCDKCGGPRTKHGGVQVSRTSWRCAMCWRRPLLATKKKRAP